MAENINALILPIGADATQFKRSIKEVEDRIKELSSTIKNTPFNLVSDKQKLELNALKETLVELQSDVINTGQAFDKNSASVKKAGKALTSLSLIAQDAPFGFIGIQNNLPALIQSFGELTTTSGGVKGALSQLGSALIGPAGLFLAFSAVTAAVTFAIKEYGSLSNAVKVLFGANSIAIKSQNEFNKALLDAAGGTGGQIAKINILVKTIQNENTSQKNRLAAYRELKRVNPDVVAGIDKQNLSTAKSIKLIGENAKAQLEFIKLQVKASAISKTLDDLESKRFDLNGKYVSARKQEINLEERLAAIDAKKGKGLTYQEKSLSAQRITRAKELAENTAKVRAEISQLTTVTEGWYNQLEPTLIKISQISSATQDLTDDLKAQRDAEGKAAKELGKNKFALELDSQDLDAAFNLDKIISNVTKYGNVLLDTNKSIKDRKEALKELIAINPQVFSSLTLEKNGLIANKEIIEQYTRSLAVLVKEREFDARASQINTQFRNEAIKKADDQKKADEDLAASIANLTTTQDQYGNSTDKITAKALAFTKALGQQQDIAEAINKALNSIYGPGTAEENDPVKRIEELSKRIKQAKDNFENTIRKGLQQPFDDFFSTLIETGKFSLDSFEGLFKDMLKRIAAQIVSAGIAKLISSILFPPGATADALAGAAAGNAQTGGIIGALLSLFSGRRAFNNVDFGGVNGGAMQMAGAVNLTLRGSDLVASINRTNTTINRVG
jgi:hypothetical protein